MRSRGLGGWKFNGTRGGAQVQVFAAEGMAGAAMTDPNCYLPERRQVVTNIAQLFFLRMDLERWELGQEIARPVEWVETAGRFHLAHAGALFRAGDVTRARVAV